MQHGTSASVDQNNLLLSVHSSRYQFMHQDSQNRLHQRLCCYTYELNNLPQIYTLGRSLNQIETTFLKKTIGPTSCVRVSRKYNGFVEDDISKSHVILSLCVTQVDRVLGNVSSAYVGSYVIGFR